MAHETGCHVSVEGDERRTKPDAAGMAWHVVSLRRSSSHKRETRAIFVLTRKVPSTNSVRRPEKSAARLCLAAMDAAANRSAGWRGQSFPAMEGGDTFAAEGRVREVKGRRTGRDFRSRGGRIVFFCGFGKRKPPERERLGLKLERARLMTDQFCAAGSQAQRGGGLWPCPRFPTLRWVGVGGVWLLGTGRRAVGIAGMEPALGGCGRCRPSPGGAVERWSRCWGQGQPNRTNSRLADGRQKNSTQSQHRHAFVAARVHCSPRVHRTPAR